MDDHLCVFDDHYLHPIYFIFSKKILLVVKCNEQLTINPRHWNTGAATGAVGFIADALRRKHG